MMILFWVSAPRNSLVSRGCGKTHCKFSRNAARCNHHTGHKLNRTPLFSQQPPWKSHNLWLFIMLSFSVVTAGRNHDVWILRRYMGSNYRPAMQMCSEIESQSSASFHCITTATRNKSLECVTKFVHLRKTVKNQKCNREEICKKGG